MCESCIPLVRASVNEARCSVRRTTGAERLMCSGSWAPRSLCKRLCRGGALGASLSSDRFAGGCARAMMSARSASSSLAGYPGFLLVHAPIMKKTRGFRVGPHTFHVNVCRPVAFHMGYDAFPAAVEAWVVVYTDARARSVEIVESCRQWWQRRGALGGSFMAGFLGWR